MRLNVLFVFIVLVTMSCKKDKPVAPGGIQGPLTVCPGETMAVYSVSLSSPVDYILWTVPDGSQIVSGQGSTTISVNFGTTSGAITVKTVKNDQESVLQSLAITIGCPSAQWCRIQNFPGTPRYAAYGYSVNNKGYFFGGQGSVYGLGTASPLFDLWEFDPSLNNWKQKGNIPGSFSYSPTGVMVLSNMVYAFDHTDSLWSYNVVLDKWLKLNHYPGNSYLTGSSVFSLNNIGYVCCGQRINYYLNDSTCGVTDVCAYDPLANAWTKKKPFPGGPRQNMCSFSSGNYAYLFDGFYQTDSTGAYSNQLLFNDMWRYDAVLDSFTRLNPTPFKIGSDATVFVANGKAYVVGGTENTFLGGAFSNLVFEYDIASDIWKNLGAYPGRACSYPSSFVINGKAFLGFGYYNDTNLGYCYLNQLFSYCQ
jgi:hypothetical protein